MNKSESKKEYWNCVVEIQRDDGVCRKTAVMFYPQLNTIMSDILHAESDEEHIIATRKWVDTIAKMKRCDRILRSDMRKDI